MNSKVRSVPHVVTGALGRRILRTGRYLADLTVFVLHALFGRRGERSPFNRATYQAAITQVIFTGIDALPAVLLLATAVGAAITAPLILWLGTLGAQDSVAGMLTGFVGLELAPLLTAVIVIGRTGSAITVDLGNMQLRREVEGLALLGIDVQDLFVAPRLVGVAVSQLALAVFFALFSVVTGVFFSAIAESFSQLGYLLAAPLALDPGDLVTFTLKNLLFGVIIGGAACYHGLLVRRSPTELPQQTQRSIINTMVVIFLLDGLIAVAVS